MVEQSIVNLAGVRFRWPGADRDLLDLDGFQVSRGERLFIRGASGSGKSTLLSLVGGIVTPNLGEVSVLDYTLGGKTPAERDAFRAAHIGLIFQMFNLIPYLPLLENVILPCRFSKLRRDRALTDSSNLEQEARRLLCHLGLEVDDLSKRPVAELSVGQQQRVAAARALIGRPELIIADEPTSALDTDTRQSFLELLFNEAASSETTILFVSHDPSLASTFDRVIQLADINRAASQR